MTTRLLSLCLLCSFGALHAASPATPLNLDVEKRSAPIQPFIYGQFIEHLGRCIYGGIWAEMLEDRKFFYPITQAYAPYRGLQDSKYPVVGASPWQVLGSPNELPMRTSDVFVGEHTPELGTGVGISQHDLGFVAGKAYTGYLWTKSSSGAPAALLITAQAGSPAAEITVAKLTVPTGDYSRQTFDFIAPRDTDKGSLQITVLSGSVLLGTVSLMPADNVHGMRRDTLALLKQLGSPIYRWPGGNFTSGYDWRDGVGDRDRRPPRSNPAWTGVEHNDFGTDEFLTLCRELGTAPMIAANTGFGDAYSAAQWVEYCNGNLNTPTGAWRARNGHPAPYAVKYWCVGNEMFGPWQLGFMQLHQYTFKHTLVAKAMRAVDPGLVLSGVGAIDTINKDNDPTQAKQGITWSEGMLRNCADTMDLISEHGYDGRVPWKTPDQTPALSLPDHVALLKDVIRHIAERHRALQARLPELKGRIVPIALDEWNYWHREYEFGELGCSYDLADGLGVAAGLHEFFRQSDLIHMAHYAQTVNVIGAIKTSKTAAEMETTGLVLQLYRAHFGSLPLKIDQDFGAIDISAALTADGRTLTIAIINPTDSDFALPVTLSHAGLGGKATCRSVSNHDEHVRNSPGQPRHIDIVTTENIDASAPLVAAAKGCSVFSIPLK